MSLVTSIRLIVNESEATSVFSFLSNVFSFASRRNVTVFKRGGTKNVAVASCSSETARSLIVFDDETPSIEVEVISSLHDSSRLRGIGVPPESESEGRTMTVASLF